MTVLIILSSEARSLAQPVRYLGEVTTCLGDSWDLAIHGRYIYLPNRDQELQCPGAQASAPREARGCLLCHYLSPTHLPILSDRQTRTSGKEESTAFLLSSELYEKFVRSQGRCTDLGGKSCFVLPGVLQKLIRMCSSSGRPRPERFPAFGSASIMHVHSQLSLQLPSLLSVPARRNRISFPIPQVAT